jgi:F420-non-reducing hydrogenase large subunit
VVHPVLGLPGGVTKPYKKDDLANLQAVAAAGVDFALFSLQAFNDIVLKNKDYVGLITGDAYINKTYYIGMVDGANKVNFYDGMIRTVTPAGKEFNKFASPEYTEHIGEHVEPWSYIKFPFLKKVGWQGWRDGEDSAVYRTAPLARLNASDGMATPLAQAEYEKMYATLGGKPVHFTLAYHWARLIEALYAAEHIKALAHDSEILDPKVRAIPSRTPEEGVGIVEAPRGLLIHHYKTDPNGIIEKANIIVATQHNSAAMNLGLQRSAKAFIKGGKADDGILNMVEMTYRAYDPCHGCGTHTLPGHYPLSVRIYDHRGEKVQEYNT